LARDKFFHVLQDAESARLGHGRLGGSATGGVGQGRGKESILARAEVDPQGIPPPDGGTTRGEEGGGMGLVSCRVITTESARPDLTGGNNNNGELPPTTTATTMATEAFRFWSIVGGGGGRSDGFRDVVPGTRLFPAPVHRGAWCGCGKDGNARRLDSAY
jgi:hypothetical protein